MLLGIVWRFGAGRIAIITVYALFASFGWLAQGAVGAWTSASQYFLMGVAVLGLFLGPAAVLLGFTQPSRSWRWGLWLSWPLVPLSVYLLTSLPGWTLAVIGLPVVTVPLVCAVAWVAAIGREGLGGLLARPAGSDDTRPDTSLMPMTAEELAAEASWHRPASARGKAARPHRAKRHKRR